MFVHLGGDVVVLREEIIAILDYRANTKEIPKGDGSVQNLAEKGKEKSWVITTNEIFISPISSGTLKKRAENFYQNVF